MKAISFTATFHSAAMLELDPRYKIYGLDKKEPELSKAFKEKTATNKGYELIASQYYDLDDETIFILKKGKNKIKGNFEFLGEKSKMNVDTLVEIFEKLKNRMKINISKERLTQNYEKKIQALNKLA